MNLLISQFFGIGDVVFSMQLARNWIKDGHTVTWPVLPQFVDQLKRAYPFITWMDSERIPAPYHWRDERDWYHEGVTYRYIPLRWANEILGHSYDLCMKDKYSLFEMDFQEWRKGAIWERDEHQENLLIQYLAPSDPYIVVNNTFGSDSSLKINIKISTEADLINMSSIEGFSLFDWGAVLKNASEIHTVSTSIIYLLEMLDLTCPIHLYPRPTDPAFKQVEYIFTKPYILH